MSRTTTAYAKARQLAHQLLAAQPGWPAGTEQARAIPAVDWAERVAALALLSLGLVRTEVHPSETHTNHKPPAMRTVAVIDFKSRAAGEATQD